MWKALGSVSQQTRTRQTYQYVMPIATAVEYKATLRMTDMPIRIALWRMRTLSARIIFSSDNSSDPPCEFEKAAMLLLTVLWTVHVIGITDMPWMNIVTMKQIHVARRYISSCSGCVVATPTTLGRKVISSGYAIAVATICGQTIQYAILVIVHFVDEVA